MKNVARSLLVLMLTGFLPAVTQAYTPVSYGISRAEFVRMVMQEKGIRTDGGHCFTDVTNQSYAGYVCAAKQRGIVTGKADGSFWPDQSISFIEAAAIVVRAEQSGVHNGNPWYAPYLEKVSDWDAIPSGVYNILDAISSSQAQQMIDAAIDHDDNDDDDDDDDNNDDNNDEFNLTVTASDSTVEADDTVTFRIRIKNEDNDDLENLDVRAVLDSDMDFVSASDSGDHEDDDEVTWDNIDVEEDETKTLLLTVRVDEDADEDDTLRLKVDIDDSTASKTIRVEDDDDDNDDDNDIDVTITDSKDSVEEGDTFTYTIRLENNDNDDIRVDINAVLDDDLDFVSASDSGDEQRNEVDWDDIRIDGDATKTLSLTVRVSSGANDGQRLKMTVSVGDEEEIEYTTVDDQDDDDDDDNDDDNADIDIEITDNDDPVEERDTIIYRIVLENNENDDVEVDVVAELDDGMSFLDASHNGEEDDDEVRWDNIEIDEDGERVLTLEVRVNSEVDDGDTVRLRVEAGDGSATETTKIEE